MFNIYQKKEIQNEDLVQNVSLGFLVKMLKASNAHSVLFAYFFGAGVAPLLRFGCT